MDFPCVKRKPEIKSGLDDLKHDLYIGIFGSYFGENQNDLVRLQNFLKDDGYSNTLLATDLRETSPRRMNENENTYNQRISRELVEISYIHIFTLFPENDGQHGINNSVLGEIEYAFNQGKKNVFIYYHKRVERYIGSYFARYLFDPPEGWKLDQMINLKLKYEIISGELLEICNEIAPNI